MGDFRPRKLTIWVVFDVESESEVQNVQFLHPNPKFQEKHSVHGFGPTSRVGPTTFYGCLTVIIGIMKLIVFIIIAFFVNLISIVIVIVVTSIIEIPSSIGSPALGLPSNGRHPQKFDSNSSLCSKP